MRRLFVSPLHPRTLAISIAALVLFCLSLYTQFVAAGIGDTFMLLVNARMLAEGKQLYRDIFTVQPPLIVWIYLLPVYLAHAFVLPDISMVVLLGLLCVGLSAAMCNKLLKLHPFFGHTARVYHALLYIGIFVLATNPAYFFEREFIFILCILPYLLRWTPTLSTTAPATGLRCIIGVMAALGFCIKPHCFIVFVAIQLLALLNSRRLSILWSLENLIIYGLSLSYIVSIVLYTPDYIHIVLPMALATYSSANMRINGLLFSAFACFILGVAFVDFTWRATSPLRADIYYLLALVPAFWLYALTNNGWSYTYYPLISFSLLLTLWVGMEYRWLAHQALLHNVSAKSFRFGARACALSLGLIIGFSTFLGFSEVINNCTEHLKCSRLGKELITAMDHENSFGTISGNFALWALLSDATGAHWDTRFNHLWMLSRFFESDEAFNQKHRWIIEYVANAFADDMDNRKPQVMFVTNTDLLYQRHTYVDIIAYLSKVPHFREAWTHYRHAQSINVHSNPELTSRNFEVYKRIP